MLTGQHQSMAFVLQETLMHITNLDFDSKLVSLESEWRQAYESGLAARAEIEALTAAEKRDEMAVARAQLLLERTEAAKSRIMARIDRLEDSIIRRR
jgi:hypothetical protein